MTVQVGPAVVTVRLGEIVSRSASWFNDRLATSALGPGHGRATAGAVVSALSPPARHQPGWAALSCDISKAPCLPGAVSARKPRALDTEACCERSSDGLSQPPHTAWLQSKGSDGWAFGHACFCSWAYFQSVGVTNKMQRECFARDAAHKSQLQRTRLWRLLRFSGCIRRRRQKMSSRW